MFAVLHRIWVLMTRSDGLQVCNKKDEFQINIDGQSLAMYRIAFMLLLKGQLSEF